MSDIRALVLLGGTDHPFDEAETFFAERLPSIGVHPCFIREPQEFGHLTRQDTDLVIIYCCMASGLDEAATATLTQFVDSGGALVAIHGATASFRENHPYLALIGARFVMHGPRHNFTVTPLQRPHPLTEGVEAFAINDELYVQELEEDISIHMVANYLNVTQPVAWTRRSGKGRVAYIALGHDRAVWEHPSVWRLVVNGVHWVCHRERGE